mmetsp:Transcript_8215/g.28216  ORF Transcript_8215/g.28216 Transcript_8215/m.28216 type:complete len:258 (-) Transcript_8215:1868-2641(-)
MVGRARLHYGQRGLKHRVLANRVARARVEGQVPHQGLVVGIVLGLGLGAAGGGLGLDAGREVAHDRALELELANVRHGGLGGLALRRPSRCGGLLLLLCGLRGDQPELPRLGLHHGELEDLRGARPVQRVDGEAFVDDRGHLPREAPHGLELPPHDLLTQLDGALRNKRVGPHAQLVHHNPQRPDVRLVIVVPALAQLRAEIERGAHHRLGHLLARAEDFCYTKVTKPDLQVPVQEDICALDVPVQNLFAVDVLQRE